MTLLKFTSILKVILRSGLIFSSMLQFRHMYYIRSVGRDQRRCLGFFFLSSFFNMSPAVSLILNTTWRSHLCNRLDTDLKYYLFAVMKKKACDRMETSKSPLFDKMPATRAPASSEINYRLELWLL